MPLTQLDLEALAHWDIPPLLSARLATGGVLNRVILLEAEVGPLVLRAYREMPIERLRWEHRIIGHAGEQGIPTPLPIPTTDGQSHLELEGRGYALFPWLRDRQLARDALTPHHAHAMGVFLGEMENRLARYAGDDAPRHKLVALMPEAPALALAAIDTLVNAIEQFPNPGWDEDIAHHHLKGQRRYLASQTNHSSVTAPTQFALVHGDFQDGNLFFAGTEVRAIIDWERARIAPWGWDIVRACDLMFQFQPALCRAFLDGHRMTGPVHPAALATAARFYGIERDLETWLFRVIYQEGNDRARRFLKAEGFRPFHEKWDELAGEFE